MEDCLYLTNLWKPDTSGGEIDGEELGHIEGLTMAFSSTKLRIAYLRLTSFHAPEELLKRHMKPFNGLLE
jgi:hypothetical protein